ncbi:hypothetical protein Fleli_0944 [Bernardetia litoralis DSM 6794]|uniref:Uncharacterized protein n=1 Tax=Bernardetia litoralis (strain ATCC 23117 / DSM 6794 / NBRC 15988 / NCIMB 1366 / Fx l1 / Sio-4) TaxID=880071 RepID=I4AHG3_BERLS|nr:hypothetical protein [Bernardetia litoralis]AFM03398.1 hypothetical protein Fleli_0944 [Bernardetia litoralis DSM 6794]
MNIGTLIISINRASLFNITANTRCITFSLIDKCICIRVTTYKPVDEYEKDLYFSIAAEVEGDFIDLKCEIKIVQSTLSITDVTKGKNTTYAREE